MNQIRLGRSQDNDVILDNPTVSRNHAIITKLESGYTILDNNSSNGTFINGIRIHGEVLIQPNDILKLGTLIVPWINYFKDQNPSSINRTQIIEQEQQTDDQPHVPAYSQPSQGKSVNLKHLTKPNSVVRKIFGILFLIIGLGLGILGMGATGDSQQRYNENNVGYEDVQFGSVSENQQSRDEGAVGVAFIVSGLALLISGIVMLSTKSRSQRRYEAEIELLKKIQD